MLTVHNFLHRISLEIEININKSIRMTPTLAPPTLTTKQKQNKYDICIIHR
jgi:hypothetical protein